MELQLRGDASWARLTTAAGDELIDALGVDVHQLRVGIDVSRPVRTAGGTLVEPFGEVHARRDGGSGQTGAGLEVAGGLRVARGVFRVEGMGRLLALHAADGYREHGGAVTLSVGDGARQPGLTLSLSPRWGARATASDALWQDHLFHQRAAGAGRDERALDARRLRPAAPGRRPRDAVRDLRPVAVRAAPAGRTPAQPARTARAGGVGGTRRPAPSGPRRIPHERPRPPHLRRRGQIAQGLRNEHDMSDISNMATEDDPVLKLGDKLVDEDEVETMVQEMFDNADPVEMA